MARASLLYRSALVAVMAGCSLIDLDGYSISAPTSGPDGGDGGTPIPNEASTPDADKPPPVWRRVVATGPPPLHSARLTYDSASSRVVLFGGLGDDHRWRDTWDWDGTSWSKRAVSGPQGRGGHGFVYDEKRGVLVVVGGQFGGDELWELGPTGWVDRSAAADALPNRFVSAAFAYDPKRGTTVFFGGHDESNNRSDTWTWDGTTLTKLSPPTAPAPRRGATLVYDEAREVLVLFGGDLSEQELTDETWLFDGSTWQQAPTSSRPPPRAAGCTAYDRARRTVVVFGGRGVGRTILGDTWLWDGTTWRQGPDGPPARRSCAMTYDGARGAVVLYGGAMGDHVPLGDQWHLE